ncbi:DnaJ and/or zf-CSL domain containing protein, partial [Asbolus verrucosus]
MTTKSEQFEDFYAVLNCNKSASYEELKQSYQQLIRKYHPDKQNESEQNNERFLMIDKAWKTLRDEHLRNQYNNSQTQAEFDDSSVIHAQLSKSELSFNDEDIFNYPCRCGSYFVICKTYLSEEEFIVECSECSN